MKSQRQAKILELITKKEITTQDDLREELEKAGYPATQATVSRDIRQMKLTKVTTSSGAQRYVAFIENKEDLEDKYRRIFRDGFVSVDTAGNILVLKTVSGMAMAVAAALDDMEFPEIVGCIAGDDTIMCAIRSAEDAVSIMSRINRLIDNG